MKIRNKRVKYDGIIYCLNEEEKTADVIDFMTNKKEIKIPSYIKHETNEYSVTSILKNSFLTSELKSLSFSEDSKLQMIDEDAFDSSSIETISIPSSVVELKSGWCNNTLKLTNISVSPNNKYFKLYENKMIIGKSNINENNYEHLLFCVRNITKIVIPDFITHISSYAFNGCNRLQRIEISNDSKLQTIDKYAFARLPIQSIFIPSQVTEIGENTFKWCKNLREIKFSIDSKLQKIGRGAFAFSSIEKIIIPSSVTQIGIYSFCGCSKLQQVEILNDSKLQTIDEYAFTESSIQSILIPQHVAQIGKRSFYKCLQLQKIGILENSKLKKIDCYAFASSSIKSITIPSNIAFIDNSNFYYCKKLQIVEFTENSNIKTIDPGVFSCNTYIMIPKNLNNRIKLNI